MDRRALYEEYLVAKAMPYFLNYKQSLENRAAALTADLVHCKQWEDACRLQGKIDGIQLALSSLIVQKPEE